MANKTVTPLDLVEILGKKTKEGISDKIAETLIVQSHAIKGIGPSPQGSEKKKKKTDRGEVRSANKQLLGKLHTDHQYLESLLKNPLLTKKFLTELLTSERIIRFSCISGLLKSKYLYLSLISSPAFEYSSS